VPTPFVVEHIFETSSSHTLEYLIHKDLSPYRVSDNREFFQLSSTEAIEHISSNYLNHEQSEKIVLLYLRQGKWEVENLTEDKWSDKARHYNDYMEEKKEQELIEEKALMRLCDSTIHEVDRYPRELWSPATTAIIENIEAGNVSRFEQAYLDRREQLKAMEKQAYLDRTEKLRVMKAENEERLAKKKQLYEEFGFQYSVDAQGKEISPFSIKHPNFHHAVQNREFVRRLGEI
jgi:hypothetical protein